MVSVVLSLLDEIDSFAFAIRSSAFSLLTKGILIREDTLALARRFAVGYCLRTRHPFLGKSYVFITRYRDPKWFFTA